MLYTEDFTMRHYVGFSQIGSQMVVVLMWLLYKATNIISLPHSIFECNQLQIMLIVILQPTIKIFSFAGQC